MGGTGFYPTALSNFRIPFIIGIASIIGIYFFDRSAIYYLSNILKKDYSKFIFIFYLIAYLKVAFLHYFSFSLSPDFSFTDYFVRNIQNGYFQECVVLNRCMMYTDHTPLFLFLLHPFHYLFNSQIFFLVIHPLVIWSSAFPLILIMRHYRFTNLYQLLLLLMFFNFPYLSQLLNFDFHFEVFFVPTLLWSFYFFEIRKWWAYILFAILFMSVKEDGPIYMAFIALAQFFCIKDKSHPRWLWSSLLLFLLSIIAFFLLTNVLMPWTQHDQQAKIMGHISKYGRSTAEIVSGIITHLPEVIWGYITGKWLNICLYFLFAPFLLPFFWIASFPFALITSTSSSALIYKVMLYYSAPFIPVIFYSFILLLANFRGKSWAFYLLVGAFVLTHTFGGGYFTYRRPMVNYFDFLEIMKEVQYSETVLIQPHLFAYFPYQQKKVMLLSDNQSAWKSAKYIMINPTLPADTFTLDSFSKLQDLWNKSSDFTRKEKGGFILYTRRAPRITHQIL
ncbi:MAG: DUF2079 domain-containing protein [Oligoflexia bacterium]|nr:DUF2079 domain-containing protein [Oligoflexia bacterium]